MNGKNIMIISDDEEQYEFMNLSYNDTCINGNIYISSKRENQKPNIIFSIVPDSNEKTIFSLDNKIIYSNMNDIDKYLPKINQWILLNKEKLLDFWNNGSEWYWDDLCSFVETFKKIE